MSRLLGGDKAIIRNMVGRLHVGDSDDRVKAYIESKISKTITLSQYKAVMSYAIKCHRANQDTYRFVMGGR